MKWYYDSIEEIVIVYISEFRNRLRGTLACACYTLCHVYVYVLIFGSDLLSYRETKQTKCTVNQFSGT